VDKVLTYEQNPGPEDPDYLYRAFYEYADNAQRDSTCDQVIQHQDPDLVATLWGEVPSYEASDPTDPWDWQIVEELSTTHHGYVTVHCHGRPDKYLSMTKYNGGIPVSEFDLGDIASLTNSGYYYLWYSVSCHNAHLDINPPSARTVAEGATCMYPSCCAVAFAGNTRSGFSDASTSLQCCAWDVLFPATVLLPRYFNHAGRMEAHSKSLHHELGYNDEEDFKVRYGHNLFGDPATGLWTPRAMPGYSRPMVGQDPEAPMQLEYLACKPNPASGQTALTFALNRSVNVKVGL
jgi:hypothetical protein